MMGTDEDACAANGATDVRLEAKQRSSPEVAVEARRARPILARQGARLVAVAASGGQNLVTGPKGTLQIDDVSKTWVYLASDDGRAITGQVIAIDAGWSV